MFSFKKVLLFLAVLGVCAFASQTFAVTVFQDDFESDTGNAHAYRGGPEIGTGDVGDSWTVFEGTIFNVQVCDEEYTPPTPSKYVQFRNEGTAPGAQAWANLTSADAAATLNQTVELSATIIKDSSPDINLTIALVDGVANEALDGQLFSIRFLEDGSITYYDPADNGGTTHTISDASYSVDAWQDVTLTADLAAKTFTLQAEGYNAGTGSWVGDVHKIQTIGFLAEGAAQSRYSYIDNVLVTSTVPEPGTLVLMLAGAMGLLVCAWRKRK